MTSPLSCIPNCCGCIVCETDYFDRPLAGNINNTLVPPKYGGDFNVFQIVARSGSDHMVRSNINNAHAFLDKDIVTPITRKYMAEIEAVDLATGSEAGVIISYLDAFHYYQAVVKKVSTGNYQLDIRLKNSGSAPTVISSHTFAFVGSQIWVIIQVDLQFDKISAWLRNESGTLSTAYETSYSDNTGKKVGFGGIQTSLAYTFDNFKYCEDHCPPAVCKSFTDTFDRPNAPDINDNDSLMVFGYTVSPAPRKWEILSDQAYLRPSTNGTLNPSTWRETGEPIKGSYIKFTVVANTPGTVIGFGFTSSGTTASFTFGNAATGTPSELTFSANASGPSWKPAIVKIPATNIAAGDQAIITLCAYRDSFGRFSQKATVNTNWEVSVIPTGLDSGTGIYDFSTNFSVTGNGAITGGVKINNLQVRDTFDSGKEGSEVCPKCEPRPCDICSIQLPHNGVGPPTYPLRCPGSVTYGGTWTNGVATNPASLHSINWNAFKQYGYIELAYAWTSVAAGETLTLQFSASGARIVIRSLTASTGVPAGGMCCVEYWDGAGGTPKTTNAHQFAYGDSTTLAWLAIAITELGVFLWWNGNPVGLDYDLTSNLVTHSHQLPAFINEDVDGFFTLQWAGTNASSFFKIEYLRFGRGATGYVATTNLFPGKVPYCYSFPEFCFDLYDTGYQNEQTKFQFPSSTCAVETVGEWWFCGGDPPSCPPGKPGFNTDKINTWSQNAWWKWKQRVTDYPTAYPGADFPGQAGGMFSFGAMTQQKSLLDPVEVRCSWNAGAGYLKFKRIPTPPYLTPDQPPCGGTPGETYWEMDSVGLGLTGGPIKFKTSPRSSSSAEYILNIQICIGGGALVISTSNRCFPCQILYESGYTGDVSELWMGTGNVNQTAPVDYAAMGFGGRYQFLNTPKNPYEVPGDWINYLWGEPIRCVDCLYPRPSTICATRGIQNEILKIVITGVTDNTRAWSVPDCNGGTQVGSCTHYNRIIFLRNQNVQGTYWEGGGGFPQVARYQGYFPFGNTYPSVAPNFEECKNQVTNIIAEIQDFGDPDNWWITCTFGGVNQGFGTGGKPYGQFYLTLPKLTFNPCQPFAAKTLLWDAGYMDSGTPPAFPPVNVPSDGPGFNGPQAWGCNMKTATVTVEGILV